MSPTDARLLARRCCGAVSSLATVGIAVVGFQEPYALARELFWIQGSGYAALAALLLALTTSPLVALARFLGWRVAPGAAVGAFRRALGLSAATFATAHATLVLTTYLSDAWLAVLGRPFLRSGALALCILLAMALTSFPRLVRVLRVDLWKQLHVLGFVAALLVLHHLLLSPFAPRALIIAIFFAAALIAPFRLMRGR
jgi:sulfoxide reductase heme-binding subunit YedZ